MLVLFVLGTLIACKNRSVNTISDGENEKKKAIVGVASPSFLSIMNFIKGDFEKEYGTELEIKSFDDYVMPNVALAEGTIDATLHQHIPYLEAYNESYGTDLVMHNDEVIFLSVRFLVSDKINSIDEIKDGDIIAINDDFSNRTLGLKMLAENGLIEIEEGVDNLTQQNITSNPQNLQIVELGSSPQIVESLPDVTVAFVTGASLVQSGRDPRDNIAVSSDEIAEANAVGMAVRAEDTDSDWGRKLKQVLVSKKVEEYLETEFKGTLKVNRKLRSN